MNKIVAGFSVENFRAWIDPSEGGYINWKRMDTAPRDERHIIIRTPEGIGLFLYRKESWWTWNGNSFDDEESSDYCWCWPQEWWSYKRC